MVFSNYASASTNFILNFNHNDQHIDLLTEKEKVQNNKIKGTKCSLTLVGGSKEEGSE
jgi:hypothetical protein